MSRRSKTAINIRNPKSHRKPNPRIWALSGDDQTTFVDALLNPPAPNVRMKAAAKRYKGQFS